MKFGIVGKGKMGFEIAKLLIKSSDLNNSIIWFCRQETQLKDFSKKVNKMLRKQSRLNNWSEEVYNRKLNSIHLTLNLDDFHDCDYIFESIVESLEEKQKIFEELSRINSSAFYFTNTSSIPLPLIFKNVKSQKCLGLHFFYPAQMIPFVEINTFSKSPRDLDEILELIEDLKLRYIILPEKYNYLSSQLLINLCSLSLSYLKKYGISTKEIDAYLKESFTNMGIFEILDETGAEIIFETINNLNHSCNSNAVFLKNVISKYLDLYIEEPPSAYINTLYNIPEKESDESWKRNFDNDLKMTFQSVINPFIKTTDSSNLHDMFLYIFGIEIEKIYIS